jgi:hypothetical protein
MKQIRTFYLRSMGQSQSLRFFENVYEWIEQIEDSRFQAVLQVYLQLMTAYREAMTPPPDNLLTIRIAVEDECIDSHWYLIREKADELLAQPLGRFPEAGAKIDAVLKACGSPAGLPAAEKTAAVALLCSELEKNVPTEILHLTDMNLHIAGLKRANWSFTEFNKARSEEIDGRFLTYETMAARKEMEKGYLATIAFVNAMAIYHGDSRYASIIDRINQLIDRMEKTPRGGESTHPPQT